MCKPVAILNTCHSCSEIFRVPTVLLANTDPNVSKPKLEMSSLLLTRLSDGLLSLHKSCRIDENPKESKGTGHDFAKVDDTSILLSGYKWVNWVSMSAYCGFDGLTMVNL